MLSFWTYVPVTGEPVDPVAAGEALRACHAALREFHGSLPLLSGLTEAEALLARLAAEETLDPRPPPAARAHRGAHAALGSLRAPIQPLHGDAHLGNVLNGPDGPLWNDWEDTCLGPVGWDAACLSSPRRDGGASARRRRWPPPASSSTPPSWRCGSRRASLQVAVWRAYVARDLRS